jgi:hypothetical protein
MLIHQKRVVFYVIFYSGIALILCLSLGLNIRSASINGDLQDYTKKLAALEEENRELNYIVSTRTSLSEIDTLAKEKLGMAAPRRIYYLKR